MHSAEIHYQDNGADLEGFVAHPKEEKRPLVILCHAWKGRDAFICEKAQMIAKRGYVGFALDMYGRGILGKSKEENAALKNPFIQDRHLLQRRVVKALEVSSRLPYVDSKRVAAIGFGFGGICALDLARSGADLKGAVSIYGHFDPRYKDPVTPQEELRRFEKEMNEAKVDWQAHVYGNAMYDLKKRHANPALKKDGVCACPLDQILYHGDGR